MSSFLTALFFILLEKIPLCFIKPACLMKDGEINETALKKSRISVEELMSRAREQGIFNIGDIDTAILEPGGKISFLLMPMKRQLTPKDFNFAPIKEGLCYIVIKNGEINEKNLKKSGITKSALLELLEQRGQSAENIFLATVNEAGRVDFFSKRA